MNEWFEHTLTYWQAQIEPWMPWADETMQTISAWLSSMPAVVWVGAALWLAMGVADRVQRWGGLRSTAYWGCGALLAALCLALWPASTLLSMASRFEWLLDMALGWILFTVGQQMDMRWLLRNKALAATAVLEFAVTAFAVSALLAMLGLAWPAACVAGIVAAHSSPVVLASFMPDWQPDGQISARGLHLGGINTLLAALCLPLVLVLGQAWQQGAAQSTGVTNWSALPLFQRSGWELAQPLMLLLLSLAVGAALGRLLARPKKTPQNPAVITRLPSVGDSMGLVAAACVCAGLAQWWGAPAWAACLALGLALRSPTGAAWRAGQGVQQAITTLAQLVLFGLSALTLIALMGQSSAQFANVEVAVGMMIPLVALILLVRLLAKLLVCTLTARWAALRWQQGFALGLAMQPLSFTGLALLLLAWPMLMQGDALLASCLGVALVISDCLAPMGMRALLRRCGEIAPEEIAGMNSRNSTQPVRVDTSRDSVAPSLTPHMVHTAG
jgi:Kef-type K+ transport system membrane component KefB